MTRLAASCCALLVACAARGPTQSPRAAPVAAAKHSPPCTAAAPPGDPWRRGHELPPLLASDHVRNPRPSPLVTAGTLPPVPFTRWPAEMSSWSSREAHASMYVQRWPREVSPEAFLRHHLDRLTENNYVDIHVIPGSMTRNEVERGGRRFLAEEIAFTSAGHPWRNLLYATALAGEGVCAFGVTAAELAPRSEAMDQFLRLVDGAPR